MVWLFSSISQQIMSLQSHQQPDLGVSSTSKMPFPIFTKHSQVVVSHSDLSPYIDQIARTTAAASSLGCIHRNVIIENALFSGWIHDPWNPNSSKTASNDRESSGNFLQNLIESLSLCKVVLKYAAHGHIPARCIVLYLRRGELAASN